jgi:cob(I)alamin adenosyltransferase
LRRFASRHFLEIRMKIYTRAGDGGETALIGGGRVPKWHPRMEACGALDELSALLGALRLHATDNALGPCVAAPDALGPCAAAPDARLDAALEAAQWDLFALGAALADPSGGRAEPKLKFPVGDMEADIDRMLPGGGPGRFVLPAGDARTVAAHHARTVCRRAERLVARLCAEGAPAWTLAHLNRLGDWLFAVAVAGVVARD